MVIYCDQETFWRTPSCFKIVLLSTRLLAVDLIELIFVVFRPSPSGEDSYNVRVSVDGKWLDNTDASAYCGGECVFKVWKLIS